MRQALALFGAIVIATPAFGQESEKTKITTKTETVKESRVDVLSELWSFQDAVPIACGQLDLRLTSQWITANAPANRGDSNDDFIITPSLVYGLAEDLEVSARVPVWVGDRGEIPGQEQGNADTYIGTLWRFAEQRDFWPAAALGAAARIPTGDQSSGVDGELRLALTNEYSSGIRSHLNFFAYTANGSNVADTRHFQYGGIVGLDGPLGDDGALRWVVDYMNRSSYETGSANINLLDVGCEWAISDASHLGMSVQLGLDDNDETPNAGAKVTYAWSITY